MAGSSEADKVLVVDLFPLGLAGSVDCRRVREGSAVGVEVEGPTSD